MRVPSWHLQYVSPDRWTVIEAIAMSEYPSLMDVLERMLYIDVNVETEINIFT